MKRFYGLNQTKNSIEDMRIDPIREEATTNSWLSQPFPPTSDLLDEESREVSSTNTFSREALPFRLRQLAQHPKNSVVYLALCEINITGYKQRTINEVVSSLRNYLKQCIEKGYVEESQYISDLIHDIEREREELSTLARLDATEFHLSQRLDHVITQRDTRQHDWERELAQLETEQEIAPTELDIKREQERATE